MNIWILNHYATPPDTAGSTRHFDFSRELVKREQKLTIFASSFNHRTKKEERLGGKQIYRRENIKGVEFIWIRTSPYKENDWRRVVNMLSYSVGVIPLGLIVRKRPDVILASSPHPFSGLAGYILAKIKGARFIFEVRDLWPQTFVDIGGYSKKSFVVKLLQVLEKFLYRRANRIITLAPKASGYITGLGIPNSKIAYIPNGVNPELFSDTSVRLPSEMDEFILQLRSKGKVLVGYAGAHGISNALDTIIEAANLLQKEGVAKIHFFLVGDGPRKEPLMYKAKSYGLGNVDFHNPIPKIVVPEFLRSIDIAVISIRKSPLYKYGISLNKLFDYMACAKPILWATDSVNNIVAEALCGVTVSPENPEEMAKAIIKLCSLSEDERRLMGKRGYDYVMKNHSVPVLASKLSEIL